MNTKKLIGTIIGVTMFAVLIAGATFAWLTFGTTVTNNVYAGTTMHFLVDYTKGNNVNYMPILDSNLAKPNNFNDDDNGDGTDNGVGDNENEAEPLVVVLSKNEGSTDGHAIISLTTTSTTELTKDGIVRWAICRDTVVEKEADGSISTDQIDNTCKGEDKFESALNTGKITGAGTIMLLNDAMLAQDKNSGCTNIAANTKSSTFASTTNDTCNAIAVAGGTSDTDAMIETDGVSYFVYFWLDGATITNDHLEDQYGTGDQANTIVNNLYEGYIHASANQLQN